MYGLNSTEQIHKLQHHIANDFPKGHIIAQESRSLAKQVSLGRTAFMEKMEVYSEQEYKKLSMGKQQIMYHAHIGLNTWKETADALKFLYDQGQKENLLIHRAGICLDRRMGLPKKMRLQMPAETGPELMDDADWMQLGRAAPIQPHMGDFMIGFPASMENTILALKAGVTTIGNLSQFFAHEIPIWTAPLTTSVETAKAICLLGEFRAKGVMLHSYLEDGFGALFHHCETIAGWAFMEKYLVQELMGAKLSHCIGGLTSDPVKRAGWVFALDQIHDSDCIGSMFYGDTISFGRHFTRNQGLISEYLLWDIMAQLECPTGHAVLPIPVTESIRVPSKEEILDAHILGHRIEETARRLHPFTDFSQSRKFANHVVTQGRQIFQNSLDFLKDTGVDITDPVSMLFLLKKLGPQWFESFFTKDDCLEDSDSQFGLTDISQLSQACLEANSLFFQSAKVKKKLGGKKIITASTDVHEHGIRILSKLLAQAGAGIVELGAEISVDKVVAAASENNADLLCISTHNGMALEFATQVKEKMGLQKLDIPIIMGGVLNQKNEDASLPVCVIKELKALGIHPYERIEEKIAFVLEDNSPNTLGGNPDKRED